MKLKAYFAGSIRGGRNDQALYARMIDAVREKADVLTEHIGLSTINLNETKNDCDIHTQDVNWMKECDFVIAECTNPSLGVGYELASAEHLHKPVHIFYNTTRTQLSAMLKGDPYFMIHPYTTEEELFTQLHQVLEAL